MTDNPVTNSNAQQFGIPALVAVIVGVLLAIVKALVWARGKFDGQVMGYALAGALVPGAIAYAIGGRRRTGSPNKFAFWFLLLSIFFLLLELHQH
jgi:hypothetical protein